MKKTRNQLSKMNLLVLTIRYTLDGINCRLNITEEKISELNNKAIESIHN